MTDIDALIAEADGQLKFGVFKMSTCQSLIAALTAERALSDRLAGAIEAYQNATPRYDWFHHLDAALTAHTEAREEPHDKG